jgi:hypothetical protein
MPTAGCWGGIGNSEKDPLAVMRPILLPVVANHKALGKMPCG